MPEKKAPQAAYLEEYDDDQNKVRPGIVKQATHRRASSVRPPQKRDAASDSGYSSQHGVATTSGKHVGATANTSAARQASRPKAVVIHRSNSQRDQQPPDTSAEASTRNPERRYTLPKHYTPEQLAAWNAWYTGQAQYATQAAHANAIQYAQPTPANATPGTSARRASISTQARPVSMHGYIPNAVAPHGSPAAPSAYQSFLSYHQNVPNVQPYPQAPYQAFQRPVLYGSVPPTQMISTHVSASPVTQPSPNQMIPPTSTFNQYSARQANPAISGFDWAAENVQRGQKRIESIRERQRQPQIMPASRPSSDTDSDTESEDSEEELERTRRARKAMPPPSRRPSVHRNSVTVPEVPRASREPLHRAPRSDGGAYDLSSSDNYSSDRTARAVVSRPRPESSHSSRSRRLSISTEGSRGTKPTSVSSGSSYQRVIVEDQRGRRAVYIPKEETEQFLRGLQRLKIDQEQIIAEEYQRGVSGPQVPELTAENIRQATQRTERRASGSHVSGRSRRSAGSSSKASKTDGIEIKAGGTVLHVYGDAKIEMQAADDGGLARLVFGGSSRDSAYHGSSKGSGSRIGKKQQKIPEDGYESGH
ncbi:hypothetical protein Tdes44962_MAKER06074 [Teratosphaeria destructans]|uniref:Uncharacterized protein n=1 Tax=Teratosphaeria destructans TaxID=418781 RepID=A0A9W7SIL3_9PEZI|nr:hypothetical protein Tdes44962_MAKER06074 [Teratosphaeria destructans]